MLNKGTFPFLKGGVLITVWGSVPDHKSIKSKNISSYLTMQNAEKPRKALLVIHCLYTKTLFQQVIFRDKSLRQPKKF